MIPARAGPSKANTAQPIDGELAVALAEPYRVDGDPVSSHDGYEVFLGHVRAVVIDHWSGLAIDRPHEQVWAQLDAVLFDDDNVQRPEPDFAQALIEQ